MRVGIHLTPSIGPVWYESVRPDSTSFGPGSVRRVRPNGSRIGSNLFDPIEPGIDQVDS